MKDCFVDDIIKIVLLIILYGTAIQALAIKTFICDVFHIPLINYV